MKRSWTVLLITFLAACSGGGTGNAPGALPATSPSPQAKHALASGSASIFIPARSAAASSQRHRLWVSPSTLSVSVAASAGDGFTDTVVTAVAANSPNCTAVSGGRTCTLAFEAPIGTDTIVIYAYDAADEYNGSPVATTTVSGVPIVSGGENSLTFTLGGIVGKPPVLAPTAFSVTQGTPVDLTLTVTGEDVDGNPITKYDAPLSITQTDTTGNFTLATTSIVNSSLTPSIVLHYGGGTAPTTVTVATTSTDTANDYGQQKSSITITPIAITGLFVAAGTGVNVFSTTTGALVDTFATSFGASVIAMDNAGDVCLSNSKNQIGRFQIGGNVETASYTPTPGSIQPYFLAVSEQGTLVAAGVDQNSTTGSITETCDEWDAGVTGAPSRTITLPDSVDGDIFAPLIAPDGTLYVPYLPSSSLAVGAIPAGTTTVTKTITLPQGFVLADDAVAPDGTLYLAEYNYSGGTDSLAGVYVYAPNSTTATIVTNGAPDPTAIDTDDAGNLYVSNSNSDGQSTDTEHLYTVYTPDGAAVKQQVSTGFTNVQSLTVSGDGSQAYLLEYINPLSIAKITPSSKTAAAFASSGGQNAVIYDGTRAKAIRPKGARSAGAAFAAMLRRLRH